MCVLGIGRGSAGAGWLPPAGFSRLNGVHAAGGVSSTRHQMMLSLLRKK